METAGFSGKWRLFTAAALTVTALLVAPDAARGICPGPDPADCVDHFTCYKVWTTRGTPRFTPIAGVSLADQFETATVTARKEHTLCLPANKAGEGTIDPTTHLMSYVIRNQTPVHVRRSTIRVTNQLEQIRVDTVKPDLLLVPANKSIVQPSPPPPNPLFHNVDHYKCYKVRITSHTPAAALNRQVSASDQFTVPAKLLNLRKPRHLCTPVNKNGEGIKNQAPHLLCYAAKPAHGEPKHVPREGVFVNDQFGPLRVDVVKEREFCVPSTKSLSPSGAFLDPSAGF